MLDLIIENITGGVNDLSEIEDLFEDNDASVISCMYEMEDNEDSGDQAWWWNGSVKYDNVTYIVSISGVHDTGIMFLDAYTIQRG